MKKQNPNVDFLESMHTCQSTSEHPIICILEDIWNNNLVP